MPAEDDCQQVNPRALRFVWVRLVLSGLKKGGIRHVVLSPGSRNSPLLFGFGSDPDFICHSVIDERAAGFFALGLAKEIGQSVALCCTSGSAGAHYLPAAIEAHESGVPLLFITADRPASLQNCGAPQTIDQTELFGRFARKGALLPEPSPSTAQLRRAQRQAWRAATQCRDGYPGPVHLNFPIDKPLELRAPESPQEHALGSLAEEIMLLGPEPQAVVHAAPESEAVASFLDGFLSTSGSLALSLGPLPHDQATQIRSLGHKLGVAVLSEFCQGGSAVAMQRLLQSWMKQPDSEPRRLLHFGAPLVSWGWDTWQENTKTELYFAPGQRFFDPVGKAKAVLPGTLDVVLFRLLEAARRLQPPGSPHSPLSEAALSRARKHTERALQKQSDRTDLALVWAALAQLDSSTTVILGNSLPVRMAAWLAPTLPNPLRLYFTRGANGIDGSIAAAVGLAKGGERPAVAILGDVTAAHDISSLALAETLRTPLVLLVVDNAGGRIFEHLPANEDFRANPNLLKSLLTPPALNWAALAEGFGVRFACASSKMELESALKTALAHSGTTLLHCPVLPTTTQFCADLREKE